MADTYDILTLIEGYRAINDTTSASAGTGPHDDRLAQVITGVSRRLDEIIGPVVNRTVTEYHDGGTNVIRPRQTPLSSVTTLKEYDGTTSTLTAETFGTEPADAYVLDTDDAYAHRCRIYRRSGGADVQFPAGRRNIELVYTAGRAASTAAVDARIKECASEILRRLWKREGAIWSQSSELLSTIEGQSTSSGFFRAIDPMVSEMLPDEVKVAALVR